jgi:hypothetical protein
VRDRARGLRWPRVAQRNDVSVRQCLRVWAEWVDSARAMSDHDPVQALFEALEQLDAVIEDAAMLAENTRNSAVALGAVGPRTSGTCGKCRSGSCARRGGRFTCLSSSPRREAVATVTATRLTRTRRGLDGITSQRHENVRTTHSLSAQIRGTVGAPKGATFGR